MKAEAGKTLSSSKKVWLVSVRLKPAKMQVSAHFSEESKKSGNAVRLGLTPAP